jgi:hypothetical protein
MARRVHGTAASISNLATQRSAVSSWQPAFAMKSPKEICLPTARLLVLTILGVLLIIVPALAQNNLPNEMLGEVHSEISLTADYTVAAAPVALPNAPVPQRVKVIDKKFIIVMAALAGAESLRFTTHKLVLDPSSLRELPGSPASREARTWQPSTRRSTRPNCL